MNLPHHQWPPAVTFYLNGRYNAFLSILPFVLLAIGLFFGAAFVLVWLIMRDVAESFQIVLVPFLMGTALLTPFVVIYVFMIRWHGKRRLEMDIEGITMVLPGEKSVYVPWEYLVAVELRFSSPRLVVCTLVSRAIRFTFSTLELNLDRRVALPTVFTRGFEVEKMRELLLYLHRKNNNLIWRTTPDFKAQYSIFYPPYDLEKLK